MQNASFRRILIIRAGALGDTILMLPLIRTLRQAFPQAYLEVMGYVERLQFALGEPYAHHVSPIDRTGLETLFVKDAVLPLDLVKFFGGFDLILSYKQDSEGTWTENLYKTGARVVYNFKPLPPERTSDHVITYLLKTLKVLDIKAAEGVPQIYPPSWAREQALAFWKENPFPINENRPVVAIHPGSGSSKKVWPPERFAEICRKAFEKYHAVILLISGPADVQGVQKVLSLCSEINCILVENKPLPLLAAILEHCRVFLGNDSGVTHLAAAVNVPVVALFGPTDPQIWRPLGEKVKTIRAEGLDALSVESVMKVLESLL
jgi:ADP-heptose:LPS heptosyltransferase